MAGNLTADNNGDILVDFDYNNIIIVDPNKTTKDGKISERLIDHENLVMYVNLEAEIVPRTKLSVGGSPDDRIRTISIAKMNFLKPTKNTYLGSGYYDELTGENSTKYEATNQPKEIYQTGSNQGKPYVRNSVASEQNVVDNGLLGITSISVRTSTSFIPTVSIKLEDVQGKALFQLGNNSPYAAFFNLPYCPFYLTMKGYYGQAIRYQLNLEKFHASFNGTTGNYMIDLEFKGYKFNILNEISMGHLLATPHMYSTRFDITQPATESQSTNSSKTNASTGKVAQATTNSDNVTTQIVAEKGYQKIVEVYSEYKAKKLIPPDFPELTLAQLMNKLDTFEQAIVNSYPKANLEPLTNIRNYQSVLKSYFAQVRGAATSWFNTYLDSKPIVLKDKTNVYIFKEELNAAQKSTANSLLKTYIEENNKQLAENPTLGAKGTSPINNNITYDTLLITVDSSQIDWNATTTAQTGILLPSSGDTKNVQDKLSKRISPVQIEVNLTGLPIPLKFSPTPYFIFEGNKRFDKSIADIETESNKKLATVETALSADLARKIEDNATGIGFKPTVRNVIAVIMASTEAFIRLLDDVHTNAWNVKYDPVRKNAILDNPSSAPGSDTKDNIPLTQAAQNQNQGLSTAQIPVYPWPQFFVETPEDKKGRFQLKYIADPSVVNLTKGYLYDKWPEVEFVEEYMRGLTQKFNPPISQPPIDSNLNTIIVNINAIEYPNTGIAYVNKEEIKFFYEIWERQFVTSFYSGFYRTVDNTQQVDDLAKLNTEIESNNITNSLGISSPYLSLKLKNYDLNSTNYPQFLSDISNQSTGRAYQDYIRGFFVTPYIKSETENSFKILSIEDLGRIPQSSPNSENFSKIVKSVSNTPMLFDTYPFTDPNWVNQNMSGSDKSQDELVFNTNKVIDIFQERNVIANFKDTANYEVNRPVTNFSYTKINNPSTTITTETLKIFYETRVTEDYIPTEGICQFDSPNNGLPIQTTTSILNTPYFINAIQSGVYNWRRKEKYPYIQAAYLFLNSLPLASLKERYKTKNSNDDLDYIASCFKKFGAIHKIPYSWILKLGSVWYRYKRFKETGTDILTDVWKAFDYRNGYDPINNDTSKPYTYSTRGPNGLEIQQQIILQNTVGTDITIQTGFFPKVINDFNVFYNGYDLFSGYTNQELQKCVNNGLKICNLSQSNFNAGNTRFNTLSVMIPDLIRETFTTPDNCVPVNNTSGVSYFITPSFGTTLNQTQAECTNFNGLAVPLIDNNSVYNGCVRLLWSAPNYGYFDDTQIKKPSPESYVNYIDPTLTEQQPFSLLNENNYSKIEEIFSVFDKSILNQFEQEFLNFCKPETDIELSIQSTTIGQSQVNINSTYKNFQSFFKTLMKVTSQTPGSNIETYFKDSINSQSLIFASNLKSFMEYDVILRYGNPGNFNRRIFGSFLENITDPIPFKPYLVGSLPTLRGTTTLAQSVSRYPSEWKTLETEVGFSTISGLTYTNRGSYITDFFVDNNIEFSVDNIVLLSSLIKIYATQKLLNPTITSAQFKSSIQSFYDSTGNIQNLLLNDVLSRVRKNLPNQQQLPERTIQTVIDGQQSKVENYEVFKALNDKWVAGSDFKTKTLFEDMMFMDRASRNIGDTIILDIFDLQNTLNTSALNQQMSVFTFISGILIKNNFTVMPLPAYVNFYNVQDVNGTITPNAQGSLEFANNMWGTFLNVDYRNSGPKLIAFFVGKPSNYLDLPKGNMRYRDDAFEMRRASENPLIENQKGKEDWAVSNKCVGFNVEIGSRNQGVFHSFSVSQDNGKATSETIQTQLNMVDQASGRNVATQNNSLYNLYKQRSYQCTVNCMGNALLQPTMYFNLRNVPMFNGPYFITEIAHTINPGFFESQITGVRQGIFDLPSIDNFLQSINVNLLTKLESILITKKDTVTNTTTSTTNVGKSAAVVQFAENTSSAVNSCDSKVLPVYLDRGFHAENPTKTDLNDQQLKDALTRLLPNNPILQTIIYCICYVRTYQEGFKSWNNNFATITLDNDYGANVDYFLNTYSCLNVGSTLSKNTNSLPTASFQTIDKFIQFMAARLTQRVSQISSIGLVKYYVCFWPVSNVSESYFDQKRTEEFKNVEETFVKALASAKKIGLPDLDGQTSTTTQINNQVNTTSTPTATVGATPTPTPQQSTTQFVCPPPVITSFTPTSGIGGTLLTIRGTHLEATTAITINNVTVLTGITKNNDGTSLTLSVPNSPTVIQQSNPIIVSTQNGRATSTTNFIYNPQQGSPVPNSAPPTVPPNVNTQPQQQGLNVLVPSITSNGNLLVQVSSGFGVWKIDKIPTYIYSITREKIGPNNTKETEVLQTNNSNLTPLPNSNYVSTNQQTFTISSYQVLTNVLNLTLDKIDEYKGAKVDMTFTVTGLPDDRTKYPQNIFIPAKYSFTIL